MGRTYTSLENKSIFIVVQCSSELNIYCMTDALCKLVLFGHLGAGTARISEVSIAYLKQQWASLDLF